MTSNTKEYMKEWRLKNLEKAREYSRKYRAANPEKNREAGRRWRVANPEKIRELSRKSGKKWRAANPEKIRETSREWRAKDPEKAREYNTKKNREWRANNPEKPREASKKYRINNPEKEKENKRKWRAANPEKIKEYGFKNKEKIRGLRRKWKKYKRETDPNWKLTENMRSAMCGALKGTRKSAPTMKIIGCTAEGLFKHLESCPSWELWMTRENYGVGGWDVDHIIAIAKWDKNCPLQFVLCWNKSNLQPMEHIENIKKGGR